MNLLFLLVRNWTPLRVNRTFGRLQLFSAGYMAWGHGFADAQKTMGVIALAIFAATKSGQLEHLPPILSFLHTPKFEICPVGESVMRDRHGARNVGRGLEDHPHPRAQNRADAADPRLRRGGDRRDDFAGGGKPGNAGVYHARYNDFDHGCRRRRSGPAHWT